MIVGIVSGTYSTIFIASSIAIMLQGRRPVKAQAASTPAPTTAPASRKPSRRRVS
jgi:hypothetical protein